MSRSYPVGGLSSMQPRDLDTQGIMALEDAHASGSYKPAPVALVRGRGTRVWDAEGREYLDCATGIGVAALGHAHPAVCRAVAQQSEMLAVCANGYYYSDVRARFIRKLTEITPPGLQHVFLSNSGTEAIEAAMKLARAHTGRPKIIAAKRGFHGRTLGSLSATWKRSYREPFEPLIPGVRHVAFGDADELADAIDDETAAVLLEPVQGEAGIHVAPDGYLQEARRLCHGSGALLILDEVQSGMGRIGKWFACQHFGVVPDVLCLGKALGGGIPTGATVFRSGLGFRVGQHGSTAGGNPLSCRAGLAVIEAIEQEGLLDNAAAVGAHFTAGLEALRQEKGDMAREVRGLGLMLALQLRGRAVPVLNALLERGVLALPGGKTAVRFLPPLTLTEAEADRALEALGEALG